MRAFRWIVASLAVLSALPASAEVKPQDISFESADGVDLQGTFYPSKNGGGSSTVIMMHPLFIDPKLGGWDGLAKELAEEGFNVLRFDFRGHGRSTELKDKTLFWENPINKAAMPAGAQKKSKNIAAADFKTKPSYIPMLVNDLMAARIAMDIKSDAQGTNTGNVYLIGATETAALGMLFLGAEWQRPNILPQAGAVSYVPLARNAWAPAAEEAGKDIAACVWLTPKFPQAIPQRAAQEIVKSATKLREETPMMFMVGAEDKTNKGESTYLLNQVLVANPAPNSPGKLEKLKFTKIVETAKSKNVGADLLGNGLGNEKAILDYLNLIEKDRKSRASKTHYYTKPPLVNLPSFGINPPGSGG